MEQSHFSSLLTALHTIDHVTRLLPVRSLQYIDVELYRYTEEEEVC